jgi:hypothetical protein
MTYNARRGGGSRGERGRIDLDRNLTDQMLICDLPIWPKLYQGFRFYHGIGTDMLLITSI